jgi:hypothetical protein
MSMTVTAMAVKLNKDQGRESNAKDLENINAQLWCTLVG